MSCTLKREVALQYLNLDKGSMPILFEIETSQIDRGVFSGFSYDLEVCPQGLDRGVFAGFRERFVLRVSFGCCARAM